MSQVYDSQTIQITSSAAMSADFVSTHIEIGGFDCGSMVIDWSGANKTTALLIPQFSNDLSCWCNYVSDVDARKADAASGCKMYEFSQNCFKYIRFRFVAKTNTTGAINVSVYSKRQWYNR